MKHLKHDVPRPEALFYMKNFMKEQLWLAKNFLFGIENRGGGGVLALKTFLLSTMSTTHLKLGINICNLFQNKRWLTKLECVLPSSFSWLPPCKAKHFTSVSFCTSVFVYLYLFVMHLYVYPSPHSGTFHPNKTGILALTIYITEDLRVIFANISK